MLTTKMSIRELMRKGGELNAYDYVQIEDRRKKIKKGIFVPQKYADLVELMLEKQLLKRKKDELDEIMGLAGFASGLFGEKSIQELKAEKNG